MALYNNSRWEFSFNLQDSEGTPQDLTGRDFAMSLTDKLRSPDVDLTLTTNDGTLIRGEIVGQLTVYAPYQIVKHLLQGTYYFDIVELLGEDQIMVAAGELYVKSGVTNV